MQCSPSLPSAPVDRVGAVTGLVGAAGGLGGFVPPLIMGAVYGRYGSDTTGLIALTAAAAQMQSVLRPHTQVEEVGLFPALAADYGNHLDQLVAEHRDIDAALDDSPRGALSPAGSFARNSPSPTSSITSSRSKTASFPRP